MSNPFLDRVAKQGRSGHGSLSEQRLARETGARLTPASGALLGAKSDAVDGSVRLEYKSTTKATMALERAWLEKITSEALRKGQTPALVLSFVRPDGKPVTATNAEWVCIPRWKYEELIQGVD